MMRFSEAIRLGATLGQHLYGQFQAGNNSCAVGAAFLAVGLRSNSVMSVCDNAPPAWNWFLDSSARVKCPACSMYAYPWDIVVDLNNGHRWTRERIADWIESLERERGMWPAESHEQVLEAVEVAR